MKNLMAFYAVFGCDQIDIHEKTFEGLCRWMKREYKGGFMDKETAALMKKIEKIRNEIIRNRDRDISGSPGTKEWVEAYRCGLGEALAIIDMILEEE